MMRRLSLFAAAYFALSGCASDDAAPGTPDGTFITETDPRDADMCETQPDLPWCQMACVRAPRTWCDD